MAIVSEAGIEVFGNNVIEGFELDKLSDKKLQDMVKNVTIFARVDRSTKLE